MNRSTLAKKLFVAAMAVVFAAAGMTDKAAAASGVVSATPATFSFVQDSTIVLDLHENSGASPVNAVSLSLSYPTDTVQFERIDASGSGFDVQADANGGSGAVKITRGKTGAPLVGDQRVARLVLKAKNLGYARVKLEGGSALLTSDTNQNVLATTIGSTVATIWVVSPRPGSVAAAATSAPVATVSPTPTPTRSPTSSSTSTNSTSTTESSSSLPDTGPAAVMGGVVGMGAMSYGAWAWIRSRRSLHSEMRQPSSK
jgi:hypothetical protein